MCQRSLVAFCREAWKVVEPMRTYRHNWHIEVICDHLEALFWGRPATVGPNAGRPIRNLVINIPPRHMKSLICSVMFPAWCWIHDPGRQFFYSSYSQALSDEHGAKMMKLVESPWYQLRFGETGNPYFDEDGYVALSGRQQTRHFETAHGGARQSSSVGGKTTGAGGDIIATDDPHNVMEKESEKRMARSITWWSRAMASRGNDPRTFCRLVVMQRVSESDLSEWCISQGYDLLKIPARYEGDKALGVLGHEDPRTEENEPMWKGHFDHNELSDLEASLKDDAAGQLQQRPAPAGGMTFKTSNLRIMSQNVRDRLLEPGVLDRLIMVWDLASKGRSARGKKRSWNVGAVWGRKGTQVALFDVWRKQCEFDELLVGMEMFCAKWSMARPVYIEDKAAGPQAAVMLRRRISGIMMVEPKGDKDERAKAIAPFVNAGDVWVPDDSIAPWMPEWRREHAFFPNARGDDQVDTTSMALDLLLVGGWANPAAPSGGNLDLTNADPQTAQEAMLSAARRQAQVRARFEDSAPGGTRVFTGRRS